MSTAIDRTPGRGELPESAESTADRAREVGSHLESGTGGAGAIGARRLTGLLVRLKWTLWRRSFRGNVGKVIGTVVGVLYGIGGLAAVVALLGATALLQDDVGPEVFPLLARGLAAVVVLAWLVLPLVSFGLDDTLDPRRLAALPRGARELQPGLLAAAMISLPALFTVIGVLILSAAEVTWMLVSGVPSPAALVAGILLVVPANLLGVGLCLLLPRAVLAQSSTRQSSRRGRELGGVLTLVVVIGGLYAFQLALPAIMENGGDLAGPARTASAVLAWTPFGALFAVPLDVAEGHPLIAAARLLIGLAAIALMWRWWGRSIDLALRSALAGEAASGRAATSPLVPRFVRADATGAAMGRSLRYWRRDSRYLGSIAVIPLMIALFTGMGMINPDQRPLCLVMLLFVCGLSGMSVGNELGFDGPAGWVNITAGIPARANLRGRIRAVACLMTPMVLIATVLCPLLMGAGALVPLLLPAGLGLMMSAWGVALAVGVRLPYPTSAPGTSPMRQRGGGSANAMIAMAISMLGIWVPQIPAIVLAITALVLGSAGLQLTAGLLSLLLGALTYRLSLAAASRVLDRRYPDLFQSVRAFV